MKRRGPVDPLLTDQHSSPVQPPWLMTYADLVTLLLTCFIMLVGMSELREPDRYASLLTSMRNQFGEEGGGWFSTGPSPRAAFHRAAWETRTRRQSLLGQSATDATPQATLIAADPDRARVQLSFPGTVTTLPAPALAELDRFAEHIRLSTAPVAIRTTVDAAAPSGGIVERNLAVAHRRARHVTEALVARNIAAERIRPEILLSSLAAKPDLATAPDKPDSTGTTGAPAEVEVRLLSGP